MDYGWIAGAGHSDLTASEVRIVSQTNEELKVKLAQAYQVLFMEGLAEDTTRGHITAKGEDGTIYIKPWGVGFEEVSARDFLGVDAAGNLREGKGRLHSELILHLEIYRQRPDIFSVVHVHPFHAIMLTSVCSGDLHIVSQQGFHFGGGIPIYESPEMIRTREQARELAGIMADKPAILMRNHGVVTAGKTLEEATILAIDFEKAAREHLMVALYPHPFVMDKEMVRNMNEKIYNAEQYGMLWDYYCRKFQRWER